MNSYGDTNDKKLISAAKEDLANFRLLYDKYVKAVFRYSYHRVGRNREVAEDIVSETFVKAIENFDSFVDTGRPFVVWLYTIAHNLIMDFYRNRKEHSTSLDSLPIPPKKEEEEYIEKATREELIEKINEKSGELPEDVNNIFTLRHTEEMTFSEIANLLGKTEGAIKMKYYRGISQLKTMVTGL